MKNKRSRFAFPVLACLAALALLAGVPDCRANGAPVPAPAPAPVASPAYPTPPPAPANPAPPVIARRPEDEPAPANGPAAPRVSIFARASALLQSKDGMAATVAARDNTIATLTASLAERDRTIAAQNVELVELRAGRDALTNAVNALEGSRTTVSETVASLGFPAAALPAASPVERAGDSVEGLQAQFKEETDPDKRSELVAKILAARARA